MAAVPEQITVDDVVPSVLSEPGSFSSLKEEQTLKALLYSFDLIWLFSRLTLIRV